MPSCGILNCKNNSKNSKVKYFLLSKFTVKSRNVREKLKLKQHIGWVKAINRTSISVNVRICSKHFVKGKPANWCDINNPDWIPHLHMGYDINLNCLQYLREYDTPDKENVPPLNQIPLLSDSSECSQNKDFEINEHNTVDKQKEFLKNLNHRNTKSIEIKDNLEEEVDQLMIELTEHRKHICIAHSELSKPPETSNIATQTIETGKLYMEMKSIIDNQQKIITSLKEKLSKYEHHESVYENDDKRSLYYTGLPFVVLHTIFTFLQPAFNEHGNRKMGIFQSIVLTLMRMCLGLSFTDLGYRFNVSERTASRVFHSTLDIMYVNLKQLIIWPDGNDIKKTMPKQYVERLGHDKLVCIIDCFEIFVERPGEPMCNCQMWSQYKHHQTIKFLIGMTPQGTVSFLSKAYVGRSSDNFITKDSGFLDILSEGDYVAADRGFTVETELQMLNATLLVPTFLKGQKQLLPRHLEATRQLASYRIHIERIIGLLKNKYRFFGMCLPMTTLYRETNDIAVVDQTIGGIVFVDNQNDEIISNDFK